MADQSSVYGTTAQDASHKPVAPRRRAGAKQTFWIHPATFIFQRHEPPKLLETIWVAHPGWGYIRRRDLWIRQECSLEELLERGFMERKPLADGEAMSCPHCGMYIYSIPGALVKRHFEECGGMGEDWLAIEATVIDEKRIKDYERKLKDDAAREEQERLMEEKRERFDRIKSEAQARQMQRDRKKRLREETKQEWKRR